MSQVTYRANLSSKSFPLISQNYGRSVIVPQYDQNFSRQVVSAEDTDKDIGIPQAYYMHNVMPHEQGWQSVGYNTIVADTVAGTTLVAVFLLRDGADNKAQLGVGANGNLYIRDLAVGTDWIYRAAALGTVVTIAYVQGTTYIWVKGYGALKYNWATFGLDSVTFTGLDVSNIDGITYSIGYLVAWGTANTPVDIIVTRISGQFELLYSGILPAAAVVGAGVSGTGIPGGTTISFLSPGRIYMSATATSSATAATVTITPIASNPTSAVWWSSTTDSTDFVPSLITGAGGGAVESARGKINVCVPHAQGFIVGSADNIVMALYQANNRYPFSFKEIVNSGGLTSLDLISWDANSTAIYAYTTSGIQTVSSNQTQTVFPEVTDFISGKYFEDFDDSTEEFVHYIITAPMQKRISVVVDRYLVISYGMTSLTHALIYDLIFKRWGKLKLDHVQCFTYHVVESTVVEVPRQSLAFLKSDGSIVGVDFSIVSPTSNGTLILGKYQFARPRLLQLDKISLESVRATQTFSLKVMPAIDGKNTVKVTPTLLYNAGLAREYGCRAIGTNISLLCKGGFMLDSLVLQFHIHGKR